MFLDLNEVDREVARAVDGTLAFTASLPGIGRGELDDAPLPRRTRVATRDLFLTLRGLDDPHARALSRWVAWLAIERVTGSDTVRAAELRHERVHEIERRELVSLDDLARRIAPTPQDARGAADHLAHFAGPLRRAELLVAARRAEGRRRLDGLDPGELLHPGVTGDSVEAARRVVLSGTDGLLRAGDAPYWDVLAGAVGVDAAEGWPARLTVRWLSDRFAGTPLVEGLRPVIGPLPPALGAASFARALAAFGRALVVADTPRGPFATRAAPADPLLARRTALFGLLLLEPSFHVRALGLGREGAREQAGRIARALGVTVRLAAARVSLARALREGLEGPFVQAHVDEMTRALTVGVPAALAAVLPRVRDDAEAELVGLVEAGADRARLRDAFDEDWWRNPGAHEALRHEHHGARVLSFGPPPGPRELDAAPLVAWLAECGS